MAPYQNALGIAPLHPHISRMCRIILKPLAEAHQPFKSDLPITSPLPANTVSIPVILKPVICYSNTQIRTKIVNDERTYVPY